MERRTLHTSTLLLMAAMYNGLRPSLLTTWASPMPAGPAATDPVPFSPYCCWHCRRIQRTRSLRPQATASWSETSPFVLLNQRSAWCWTKNLKVSVCPLVAPQYAGLKIKKKKNSWICCRVVFVVDDMTTTSFFCFVLACCFFYKKKRGEGISNGRLTSI